MTFDTPNPHNPNGLWAVGGQGRPWPQVTHYVYYAQSA